MQLHREIDTVHAKGAELVFVGNGNRHWAEAFKKDHGIRCPVYVDTTRESYEALGMKRNFLGLLDPRIARNAFRALKAGFRQGSIQGDGVQNGGVLVVRPGGEIVYRHISAVLGDHPPVAEVLAHT